MRINKNGIVAKTIERRNTFKESWINILKKRHFTDNFNIRNSKDSFFNEMPENQELLTENKDICSIPIDYSNYTQIPAEKININNLFDCFHGILFFIFYYSGSKFNINELEFHYSGSKFRQSLPISNLFQASNLNNILGIFDYQNIHNEFQIKCIKNAFFGVTFKRILINPIAYSIRSGIYQKNCPHLVSFSFEGFDEKLQNWEVLDERENINNLIENGGFMIFFVRKNDKYYSSFKIKQTRPGSDNSWGFSVSAFEIHGIVSYREEIIEQLKTSINANDRDLNLYSLSYDPYIDMTDFF